VDECVNVHTPISVVEDSITRLQLEEWNMVPLLQHAVTPPSLGLRTQLDLPVPLPMPSPSLISYLPSRRLLQDQGVQKKKKVTGQRARRTGKAQGKRAAIREELELTLRDLEMRHGNF
jgi:hypothetical protein